MEQQQESKIAYQATETLGKKLDPLQDAISSLELVRVSGSDIDVANAARVSYGKFVTEMSERDEKLIRFLMKHDHTSPFEHNQLSFRVKAPIFVARQWFRHRMNAYNEISYRYVKSALEFYIPKKWRHQDTQNKQASVGAFDDDDMMQVYKDALAQAQQAYEKLLEKGLCRELSRGLLPLCTYTEFIFTCNLHSLMHFLRLRLHPGAQYEIRSFAAGMLVLGLPHFPVSLGAWKDKYIAENDDLFTGIFTNLIT